MKYVTTLIIGALLLFSEPRSNAVDLSSGDTLKIFSSPELFDITNKWVSEFGRLNTDLNIRVNLANGNNFQMTDIIIKSASTDEMVNNTNWNMIIGHDVIVPVMNAKNPMRDEIARQGISSDEFSRLFKSEGKENWSSIINNGQTKPVSLYVTDNKSAVKGMEAFGRLGSGSLTGVKVITVSAFIKAIEKDPYAIGFCSLSDIMHNGSNELLQDLHFIPIDKNGNGIIDNFENIYDNPGSVLRGAWIGKYPQALCGDIYAVSEVKPADQKTMALLNWIFSEGGQILNSNGYADLASVEKTTGINALMNNDFVIARDDSPKTSWFWLIFLSIFIAAGVVLKLVIGGGGTEKTIDDNKIRVSAALSENIIAAPKGLYFDKSHTWAFLEKDGNVRVGIDDFIQHITGKITRIKMLEPGEMVRKGEKIVTIIRDGKQIDIYAPVSGIIKEKNNVLLTDSSILNNSPYSEGWIYMIEPRSWLRETEFLFMSEKYKEWIKTEFTRLKDFFALTINTNKNAYEHIVLQDGGELTDNILADLGPEVWEDFQTKFIDLSR
jgi:glycine cleavage system H lipoate-binding protein/ABC-type phosphate transport system substrate-binding protein